MFDLSRCSFSVRLANQWIEQLDKEAALGELPDDDMHAAQAVSRHFRDRLAAQLHRMEE